jgi:hypothetical protein
MKKGSAFMEPELAIHCVNDCLKTNEDPLKRAADYVQMNVNLGTSMDMF